MNCTREKIKKYVKTGKLMLNIVLVYPGFPPEEQISGGISTFTQEIAQGLAELGHNIIVLSRSNEKKLVIEIEKKNEKFTNF